MIAAKGFFDIPPIRYIGAKWKLADWIISQFPPHEVYVEPFCGSAAVFFRKHPSALEVLNDLDDNIVNFFDMLRSREADLIRAIDLTPYARAEYERALQPCDDPLERARRFYVAVWQSFSGSSIRKTGWRHINSVKKHSSVTNTWSRLDGLIAAARRLKAAQVENMSAIRCINLYDSHDTLFYVDPPYVFSARSQGGRAVYRHEMTDDEHRTLADTLHSVKGMVLLSGYPSPLYEELYADWVCLKKTTTTNGNSQATECLWLSPHATSLGNLPLFTHLT